LSYFLWLVSMVPSFLLYFWPISAVLLTLTFVGIYFWLRKEPRPHLALHILFGSLFITLAILIYGTLHAARGQNWEPQPYAQIAPFIVLGLILVQIIINSVWLFRAKAGSRVLLSAAFGWELTLSLSAGFIALMSVSGDWL